jgi:hypothetical protein
LCQELCWRQDTRLKARRANEIPNVVGHNGLTFGGHRQFQNELVTRIGQSRSPQKMNLLPVGNAAEVVDEAFRLLAFQTQFSGVTNQYDLVLESQPWVAAGRCRMAP